MKYILIIVPFIITIALVSGCGDEDGENLRPISWITNRVSLEADDFYLIADGDTFYADVSDIDIHSDAGDSTYCTLELTWQENNVEMRLFIYFDADGTDWWSSEFRTYDGQTSADWICYYGTFFMSPLGTAFTGDFEEESTAGNEYTGKVYFQNLALQAFLNQ
jgi:hypothetical protein